MTAHRLPWLLAAILAILPPGMPAVAQEQPQKGVSAAQQERMHDRAEATRSDALTRRDLDAMHKSRGETSQLITDIYMALDANGDGLLERSELPPQLRALRADFARYDRDHDLRLSYSEFANFMDTAPRATIESLKPLATRHTQPVDQ